MTCLLHSYASAQARTNPNATAVVSGENRLTYSELETRSNQLANILVQSGCKPGERVCLFLEKSPDAIVAMHGVLKAGCAYVPIDVTSPAARVARIVSSCRPRIILCEQSTVDLLEKVLLASSLEEKPLVGSLESITTKQSNFHCDFDVTRIDQVTSDTPDLEIHSEDTAHILFTSGSTGIPKGVVITHRIACHFVDWGVKYFGIDRDDRLSGHPPLHFDLSTFDIYGTFAAGAQLHLVPAIANLLPGTLAKFIRDSELTQWFSVPSALTLMARGNVLDYGDFPTLKRLLWCGEVLPTPTLIHWMERLPHVQFTNLYGPTETTIASSYHTVEQCPKSPLAQIPIGRACEGEQLMVLDEDLNSVPPGEQGELYISGAGMSPGYWEDQEKTDNAFISRSNWSANSQRIYRTGDLAKLGQDGLIYFLGRTDSQIKSRGYRIELGEIETAMNSLGVLKDCAIVGVQSAGFEGSEICCAYVPQRDHNVSPTSLRSSASKLLPSYMLPRQWRTFDDLPKTGNGKTDRRRIREIFSLPVSVS